MEIDSDDLPPKVAGAIHIITEDIMMTFDKLKEIFTNVMPQMDASKLNMDSVLTSDLGVDSLNMLLLSISVEEEFGIQFDMNAKLDTVRDIVEYVDTHKK